MSAFALTPFHREVLQAIGTREMGIRRIASEMSCPVAMEVVVDALVELEAAGVLTAKLLRHQNGKKGYRLAKNERNSNV